MRLHKLIATAGGIGYIGRGGGTVAAAAWCLIRFFIPAIDHSHLWQVVLIILVTGAGVYSSGKVEKIWGHDSSKVVIDEVAGMMVTLLFIPATLNNLIAGLLLFRFFDIVKPLYIRRLEVLPKGWGVMADDVLAGIYGHIVLTVLVNYKLL